MEYYNSKEPIVAGKIFELGLKSFGDDADFVEQYLDFLIQLNDDNSKFCHHISPPLNVILTCNSFIRY